MHEITRDMIPVRSGVHGGDWIACDVVSPGMGSRCIFSIGTMVASVQGLNNNSRGVVKTVIPKAMYTG